MFSLFNLGVDINLMTLLKLTNSQAIDTIKDNLTQNKTVTIIYNLVNSSLSQYGNNIMNQQKYEQNRIF